MQPVRIMLDLRASQSLSLEGLRNEIARLIQVGRKTANLQIDSRTVAVLNTTDEFIRAAARVHEEYLLAECLLTQLVIDNQGNNVQVKEVTQEFNPDKWHTPVSVINGEFYYGKDYPHYWAAVYANYPKST